MGLIESIKAIGIRAADRINGFSDPFPAFDRPCLGLYPEKSLAETEAEFYGDLVNQFWGCDGRVLLHRIPLDTRLGLDTGDQALWHGVFTAMLAVRYHLLSQCEAGTENYQKAMETYSYLVEAAKGLQLHQNVHGEPKPRLIRGVKDDGVTFQDDASNDSATGHLLGIYFGWKFGPETMRPVFTLLAAGLAAELHNHQDSLVGPDGKPTAYGALEQGWKTDPLRITLALAIYATAATLSHEPAFVQDYERLFRKYRSLIPYPKVRLWMNLPGKPIVLDNYNDTHRAAIHLAILADQTTGDAHAEYAAGLERLGQMTLKDGNIWVNALCGFGNGAHLYHRLQALTVLKEFSLERKRLNPGVDRSIPDPSTPNRQLAVNNDWIYKLVKWRGTVVADIPLPRHYVRSQDFFWQRNLRSLDVGSEGIPPDSKLNCGDWLCAYWLSRLNGSLREND